MLGLQQANVKKLWELYTFKEFLNEDLMLDELAFYLHCRHLLFKGPQLSLTYGKYSSLHYVDREHVNQLIDCLMPKLSSKEKFELKSQLSSPSKMQPDSTGIDSGFVRYIQALRLLLEYYAREKKSKFLGLVKVFESCPKDSLGKITFTSFRTICYSLNQNIQETFIIKMYRLS